MNDVSLMRMGGGDLWAGVLQCCNLTVGPGAFDEVDAELHDHASACPEIDQRMAARSAEYRRRHAEDD